MENLLYPLATEKAIRLIESDNIVCFIVDNRVKRSALKIEFEEKFKAKVNSINIVITPKGKKKAYIRLQKNFPAIDIATQLGLM